MTSEEGSPRLKIRDLAGGYGKQTVLQGVNFEVACGSRLALLGPNGAGKTTLIRILAGLLPSSGGSVTWREETLQGPNREIAYLPQLNQHTRSFPMTVSEVIAMGRYPYLKDFAKFRPIDEQAVLEAIETMDLCQLKDRQIDELSGGQQQRSFIARALAQKARVIILDEPFNGLDVESRCQLAETLHSLSSAGHIIIASHHNLENAADIFDHALVLQNSQIAFGKISQVMARPAVRHLLHACHPDAIRA